MLTFSFFASMCTTSSKISLRSRSSTLRQTSWSPNKSSAFLSTIITDLWTLHHVIICINHTRSSPTFAFTKNFHNILEENFISKDFPIKNLILLCTIHDVSKNKSCTYFTKRNTETQFLYKLHSWKGDKKCDTAPTMLTDTW